MASCSELSKNDASVSKWETHRISTNQCFQMGNTLLLIKWIQNKSSEKETSALARQMVQTIPKDYFTTSHIYTFTV